MTDRRVIIQWTETARQGLRKLPPKVRQGLIAKADALAECSEPENVHKPLLGILEGYYRITYSRYRAIYSVDRQFLPNGDLLENVKICFVAAGIRKEGDKKDIYNFAIRLLRLGVLDPAEEDEEEAGGDPEEK